MRVLLTGAGGQLGSELVHLQQRKGSFHKFYEVANAIPDDLLLFAFRRKELDVTDKEQVAHAVADIQPDVIINAAAYTDVDGAETDPETAYAVNAEAARYLAEAARKHGARLCYISSDYVFDGESRIPYEESHPTNPHTVYGKSKAIGEQYVRELCPRYFIVRTSWLYGAYGRNFVQTILRLGTNSNMDHVRVVHDQSGCPTWTFDLAQWLIRIVDSENYGTYHLSNTGSTTWYGFATEILRQARIQKQVIPVTTEEFPRPARRPTYSVLSPQGLIQRGFPPMRSWNIALEEYMQCAKEQSDENT